MKRLPGLKTYKTVREALSSISKECKTHHDEVLEKISKGNEDLIRRAKDGTLQKGTR